MLGSYINFNASGGASDGSSLTPSDVLQQIQDETVTKYKESEAYGTNADLKTETIESGVVYKAIVPIVPIGSKPSESLEDPTAYFTKAVTGSIDKLNAIHNVRVDNISEMVMLIAEAEIGDTIYEIKDGETKEYLLEKKYSNIPSPTTEGTFNITRLPNGDIVLTDELEEDNAVKEFDPTIDYTKGSLVSIREKVYIAKADLTANAFDENNFTPLNEDKTEAQYLGKIKNGSLNDVSAIIGEKALNFGDKWEYTNRHASSVASPLAIVLGKNERTSVFTEEWIPIGQGLKYDFNMQMFIEDAPAGNGNRFYITFDYSDSDQKRMKSWYNVTVADSKGYITAPVNAGDTSIQIAGGFDITYDTSRVDSNTSSSTGVKEFDCKVHPYEDSKGVKYLYDEVNKGAYSRWFVGNSKGEKEDRPTDTIDFAASGLVDGETKTITVLHLKNPIEADNPLIALTADIASLPDNEKPYLSQSSYNNNRAYLYSTQWWNHPSTTFLGASTYSKLSGDASNYNKWGTVAMSVEGTGLWGEEHIPLGASYIRVGGLFNWGKQYVTYLSSIGLYSSVATSATDLNTEFTRTVYTDNDEGVRDIGEINGFIGNGGEYTCTSEGVYSITFSMATNDEANITTGVKIYRHSNQWFPPITSEHAQSSSGVSVKTAHATYFLMVGDIIGFGAYVQDTLSYGDRTIKLRIKKI